MPSTRSASPLGRAGPPVEAAAGVLKGEKAVAHLAEATVEPASEGAVGRREDAFYERLMPGWRIRARRMLLSSLAREMDVLQGLQKRWRTPFRDEYFVKTSLLGTHTFFMIFLPLWFWFGLPEAGRGLLYCLALGAYATGALKDAFSVPRPFSPPMIRLSVGSHALEYGFPSTHSSNACSMALFVGEFLFTRNTGELAWLNPVGVILLAVFAWSVTFGRLYTGMHSMADVFTGSTIGTLIWAAHHRYADALHALLSNSRWTGTLTATFSLLFILSTHPEPAEPCPCFEDTVAFLSVVLGVMIGIAWTPRLRPTASYGWEWRDAEEIGKWSGAVGVKLVGGISAILVWRIIAKQVCHIILPPLFRFFAPIIQLPRRGYQQSTEYDKYPEEPHLDPVPSILDLPSLAEDAALSSAAARSSSSSSSSASSSRLQNASGPSSSLRSRPFASASASAASSPLSTAPSSPDPSLLPPSKPDAKTTAHLHHLAQSESDGKGPAQRVDVDVLTKVVVYAGIGWIASIGLPEAFERVGLSVWR
ncbi:hypothetical protein JCM6882_000086 [Rhodosporidiobolus microsporus]